MSYTVNSPFDTFKDIDGKALEDGYVWVGAENLDPQTNPIAIYWDSALTIAASQPLRTKAGYVVNAGTPAQIYTASRYSVRVQNKRGSQVFQAASFSGTISDISREDLAASTGTSLVGHISNAIGATPRTSQAKHRDFVSILDFAGVDPTGVSDSLAGLQAAADHCKLVGAKLMGAAGTYKITNTWVIECDADLKPMLIAVNATTVANAIRVGPAAAATYLFDADIALPKVINTAKVGAGWVGFDASIGVILANVYQSRIVVPYVYNFGVGLKVGGYGVGCVYNTITIGVLFGNKINQQLKAGDAAGWSNQNTYIGGRFGYSSGEGTIVSGVKQIECRDFDGTGPGAPNNNVWINPSLEGNEPEFHLDIQGAFNNWFSPRFEVGAAIPARVNFHAITSNETVSNCIYGGYDAAGTTYTYTGAGTSTRNKQIGGTANDTFEYSSNGANFNNKSGSSQSAPHIQGFPSSVNAIEKTNSSTDWIYRWHGDGWSVKSSGDSFARLQATAGGYIYLGRGTGSPTAGFRAGSAGEIQAQSILQPETDNTTTLGAAAKRWSVVYAATGAINTSDERVKQQWVDVTAAEKRVALQAKVLLRSFRFNDAVALKGSAARIHFGIGAQSLKAAFEAEGLVAEQYAVLCHDVWPAEIEDGQVITPAGERYGVRYDELLAFIISAL